MHLTVTTGYHYLKGENNYFSKGTAENNLSLSHSRVEVEIEVWQEKRGFQGYVCALVTCKEENGL